MKILFASNSRFGEVILSNLINSGVKVDFLATSSDKKKGRGQDVTSLSIKTFAEKKGINIVEVNNKDEFHQQVEQIKPDLVITAGFSVIIKKETTEKNLLINVHPSLLPKYRGPTPIQTAIKNGDSISGVTIIKMEEEIDSGPIIDRKEVLLDEKIDYITAEDLFGEVAAKMLELIISKITNPSFNDKYVEQDKEGVVYTKKLTKEDGLIDWKNSGLSIERKIRAYSSWPGTYTYLSGKRVKIIKASYQKQTLNGPFGECGKTYLGTNHTIAVQTGRGFLLVEELQIEGKKTTTAESFLQGNISIIGSVFSSLE